MISPEILAEQVMGYVVWASELIPTLQPSPENPFSVAILPQGPHFYTWLLQAAGYLLLDTYKKKMIIISQQSDSKDVVLDTNNYGPTLGQIRKNTDTEIQAIAKKLGAKLSSQEHSLWEQIGVQLPFLRIITKTDTIIHVNIGDNIPTTKIHKVVDWINKKFTEYNVVILANIELPKPATSKKTDEQWQLLKIIKTPSSSTPLLTIFQNILRLQKQKPEIVAYVNPSDFGKPKSLTTRYVCAVG